MPLHTCKRKAGLKNKSVLIVRALESVRKPKPTRARRVDAIRGSRTSRRIRVRSETVEQVFERWDWITHDHEAVRRPEVLLERT